ncbi:MAG: hypothetical protein R3F38_11745 [Gammaproteobacteria bacterium]
MRTIHKFEIHINKDIQPLDIPDEHRYLHVEYLMHKRCIYLWVEVPADMTVTKTARRFRVFSTGDGIPDNGVYVGTCLDPYLPESYHVYELRD